MAIPKVILFYGFAPVTDPEALRLWQHDLCEFLGLTGRIIISAHGINGTLGGDINDLKSYIRKTKVYRGFNKIDFKWSEGTGHDFPKLTVRVRDEVVSFGAPNELKVDEGGVVGGGQHLSPTEVHELVESRGDDVVFFDGRNAYEARVGKFRNAIVPDVETTRDFVAEFESGKYDHLKDKPIVTYCTGGIRCEVLSAVMKSRGFEEVYQIEGGIVRYGEKYGDDGLWDGSLYIFDNRMSRDFSNHTKILGKCDDCDAPAKFFYDRQHIRGRVPFLLCDDCAANTGATKPGIADDDLVG
ncbi:MAG: rhodanese-related sulfurtransferase [Actinobacteria bacterium]|nr:rhodanese-related sulfurtransferase [Actinomycetota bacterium]